MRYFWVSFQKLRNSALRHLPLGFLIDLIANQHKHELLWLPRVPLEDELVHPKLHVLETLSANHPYLLHCDIINQHAAVSATVECAAEASEFLLTCGVPNLSEKGWT
jgi:hypothetical protein